MEQVLLRAAKVMYERQVEAGTTLINQGDTADHFYVLAEGKVQVLINGKSKRIMSPGAGFGELGVLYGLPRSASCVAQTAVRVWVLDRKPFKHIVVREQSKKRAEKENFLRSVPLVASLAEKQPRKLARLADAMDRREYGEGATLIKQGDEGDEFFIICRGSVDISDDTDEPEGPEEVQPVVTRTVGDYFGELALIKKVPRTATVVAVGAAGVSVYVLKRARFERLININDVSFRKYDRRGSLQSAALADAVAELASPFKSRDCEQASALAMEDLEQGPTVGIGGYGTVFLGRLKADHDGGSRKVRCPSILRLVSCLVA
eukprot:COSAG02_NODE_636_length_19238_cov_10.598046_1_plen_319_part_00